MDINDDLIKRVAGKYGDIVIWLRDGLNSQTEFLRKQRNWAFHRALGGHTAITILGFVASLAAIYAKSNPEGWFWPNLNVITPLVISALSSALAFRNYRGAFARNATAYLILAEVKADIDFKLLLADADPAAEITQPMVDGWNQKISTAMAQHSEDWGGSLTPAR